VLDRITQGLAETRSAHNVTLWQTLASFFRSGSPQSAEAKLTERVG